MPSRRHLQALAAVAVALVTVALSSCTVPNTYVAIGDSYTSGPLIPNQQNNPWGCLRSDHNYPHVAFPATGLARFRDVSCSGAQTKDVFAPQDVDPDGPNPPQIDAVDGSARVVTVGIGGNDIGFTGIVKNCVRLLTEPPCKGDYVHDGVDEISDRIAAVAPDVAAVVAAIAQRAPKAAILLVGYPVILPDAGTGCYPAMPILPADVPYLRSKEKELNAMLASVAASSGATFVNTYRSSIGHDVCQLPTVRWVEGLAPTSPAAPVHPNAAGMANTGRVVATAIQNRLKG